MTGTSPAPDPAPALGPAPRRVTARCARWSSPRSSSSSPPSARSSRRATWRSETLPSGDAVLVGIWQDQTDEAARLLDEQAQASIGGARDIRAALERARRGGRLVATDLLDIAETCRAADLLRSRLASWRRPHLAEVREDLDPAPALRERIERSVDESGEVLDTAPASWRPSASGCAWPRSGCASD